MALTSGTGASYKVVMVGVVTERGLQEEINRMAESRYEFVQAIPTALMGTTTGFLLVFRRPDRAADVNPSSGE
jgi:hypothetical protein